MISGKRILVLAPHTDDGELGCGGTISKLVQSNDLYYLAFSSCKQSVPDGFEKNVLEKELKAASQMLGIKEPNILLMDFEVREFNYHRQEILDAMLKVKKDISPDFVFMQIFL